MLARAFQPDLTSLNRLSLYGTVPALVFTSLSQTEVEPAAAGRLLLGQGLYFGLALGLAWLVSARLDTPVRRGFLATSTFSNSANMMLPVTLFAFGQAGLERALILYVLVTVVMFSLGPLILAGGAPPYRKVLGLPVLWAAVLGLSFNGLGWSLPLGVERGIGVLSEAAVPLVLLVLGMQVHRSGVFVPRGANWLGAGFKLLVGPLIGLAAGLLVGASGLDLAVLTLLGAMPPAVNTFMLALEFGGAADDVAQTVVLATVLSLVSLSVVVFLVKPLL